MEFTTSILKNLVLSPESFINIVLAELQPVEFKIWEPVYLSRCVFWHYMVFSASHESRGLMRIFVIMHRQHGLNGLVFIYSKKLHAQARVLIMEPQNYVSNMDAGIPSGYICHRSLAVQTSRRINNTHK